LAFIDDVKTALRVTSVNAGIVGEITDLIAAAKADLQLSGLMGESILETDALIKRAIITYVKAYFGWNNPDTERLQQSYDLLKSHLSLSQEYSYYAVTFTVTAGAVPVDEAKVIFNGETKYTGTAGTAIFYVRKGNNYEYSVTADGYVPIENNIDISANTPIAISLVAG